MTDWLKKTLKSRSVRSTYFSDTFLSTLRTTISICWILIKTIINSVISVTSREKGLIWLIFVSLTNTNTIISHLSNTNVVDCPSRKENRHFSSNGLALAFTGTLHFFTSNRVTIPQVCCQSLHWARIWFLNAANTRLTKSKMTNFMSCGLTHL